MKKVEQEFLDSGKITGLFLKLPEHTRNRLVEFWCSYADSRGQEFVELSEGSFALTKNPELAQRILDEEKQIGGVSLGNLLRERERKVQKIIDKFFLQQNLHIIWGLPASLKSFFSNYVACCVATGSKFLNRYKVQKMPVTYLSTENSQQLDIKRFRVVTRGMGVNPKKRNFENCQLIYFGRNGIGELTNPNYYEQLKNHLTEHQTKLLIIDTISPMISEVDDNQASQMVGIFKNYLYPLIDEFGLSIVALMHSQKGGRDFLGSVKIKASCDYFYEVLREEGSFLSLLCHKGREGEYNLRMKVDFREKDCGLRAVKFQFVSEFDGIQTPDTKGLDIGRVEPCKTLILKLLKENEISWTGLFNICKSDGYTKSTFQRAMRKLYESSKIRKNSRKGGGYYISPS